MLRRRCDYCGKATTGGQAVCDNCGMPIRLRVVRRLFGLIPINFPVFVILLTVLALAVALWLPR